jgi:hypothetical protein
MNYGRALTCCVVTGCLAFSLPAVATADDGQHEQNEQNEQNEQLECDDGSSVVTIDQRSGSDRVEVRSEHDEGPGHDARDGESDERDDDDSDEDGDDDDCVIAPPVDVAEAPMALMLSGTAAVTGGAAVLVIRRRARRSPISTA